MLPGEGALQALLYPRISLSLPGLVQIVRHVPEYEGQYRHQYQYKVRAWFILSLAFFGIARPFMASWSELDPDTFIT